MESVYVESGKIIKRTCPSCDSQENSELLKLEMSRIFELNPTYIKDWFNKDNISADFAFPIVQCSKCGFYYSLYKLNPVLTFSYYNESIDASKSRDKIYKKIKRSILIEFWSKLNLYAESDRLKLLDFGAGWGDFLEVAKCSGVEVYGLEFDQRKINHANRQGISCGDIDLVTSYAPYDIFMCNQVLEHLDRPKEAIVQLRELVKPGAVGLICVPNFTDERLHQQAELFHSSQPMSKDLDPIGHLNYFNGQNLRRMIFDSGFEEIVVKKPQLKPGILRSIYHRLRGRAIPVYQGTLVYVRAI